MTRQGSRAILDEWYEMVMLCQHLPVWIWVGARPHAYIRGVCPHCGPQVIEPTHEC